MCCGCRRCLLSGVGNGDIPIGSIGRLPPGRVFFPVPRGLFEACSTPDPSATAAAGRRPSATSNPEKTGQPFRLAIAHFKSPDPQGAAAHGRKDAA